MDPMGLVENNLSKDVELLVVFLFLPIQFKICCRSQWESFPHNFSGIKKIHIKKSVRFFHHLGVGRFGDFFMGI